MSNKMSQIVPLELIRVEEIPEAGSNELLRISKKRQERQEDAIVSASFSTVFVAIAIAAPTLIAWPSILLALIFAFASLSAFYTLCFGPKAWQSLPSGMSVASAQLEDVAKKEVAAWNREAEAWNLAFAAWFADAEAWSGRKDSPGVARNLNERLDILYHERKALLHRRKTLGMQIDHLQKLLGPVGRKTPALLAEKNSVNKDS